MAEQCVFSKVVVCKTKTTPEEMASEWGKSRFREDINTLNLFSSDGTLQAQANPCRGFYDFLERADLKILWVISPKSNDLIAELEKTTGIPWDATDWTKGLFNITEEKARTLRPKADELLVIPGGLFSGMGRRFKLCQALERE